MLHAICRLVDFLPIVRYRKYHPDFCGSFLIKNTLIALVPNVLYAGLAVAEGRHEAKMLYQFAGLSYSPFPRLRNSVFRASLSVIDLSLRRFELIGSRTLVRLPRRQRCTREGRMIGRIGVLVRLQTNR